MRKVERCHVDRREYNGKPFCQVKDGICFHSVVNRLSEQSIQALYNWAKRNELKLAA